MLVIQEYKFSQLDFNYASYNVEIFAILDLESPIFVEEDVTKDKLRPKIPPDARSQYINDHNIP